MSRMSGFIQRLYRRYLCAPSHPSKLRIVGLIERRLFPNEGLPFDVGDGIQLYLHPRHEVEAKLLRRQEYQASLNRFIMQNLAPGNVAALAGVSFGHQAILAAKAVGPTGCVVAIDPSPRALIRAHLNLALNSLDDNVKLVSAALGEESAATPMKMTRENNVQSGSMIAPPGSLPVFVLVETLPTIFRRLKISRLDMFVLDVIGFEVPVLRGIAALPNIITIAIHPWVLGRTHMTLEDHASVLQNMGYRCYTLEGFPAESVQKLRACQLVAVRNGHQPPRWLDRDSSLPLGVYDV